MEFKIRDAKIRPRLDGASDPMIELTEVRMDYWMVRDAIVQALENFGLDDLNKVLKTEGIAITDLEK